MKFKLISKLYIILGTLFISTGCSLLASKQASFKIIYTNDIHGNLVGDENADNAKYIGASRIASYISEEKRKIKNLIVIDAGDMFHGSNLTNLTEGQVALDIMNIVGYDYFLPGNHDFNFGKDRLIELTQNAKFKTICSNILTDQNEYLFKPNEILEVGKVKIGLLGLNSPETQTKSDPSKIDGLNFEDPIYHSKKQVKEILTASFFSKIITSFIKKRIIIGITTAIDAVKNAQNKSRKNSNLYCL